MSGSPNPQRLGVKLDCGHALVGDMLVHSARYSYEDDELRAKCPECGLDGLLHGRRAVLVELYRQVVAAGRTVDPPPMPRARGALRASIQVTLEAEAAKVAARAEAEVAALQPRYYRDGDRIMDWTKELATQLDQVSLSRREQREAARRAGDIASRPSGPTLAEVKEESRQEHLDAEALREAPWRLRLELWWMGYRLRRAARHGFRLVILVPTAPAQA